jgi:hypothetical protein
MRNFIPKVLVILCLALAFAAQPSVAGTFGGEVFGAMNTYGMEDWNDAIDQANSSGSDYNEMTKGITGGLGARWWLNANWMIQGTWEPLFAETEDETSGDRVNLDANSFQLGVAYFFPSMGTAKYGFGAGVGMYTLSGEAAPPSSPAMDIEGSTVGFHFMGHGEWAVSRGFAINAGAGWRIANIDDGEIDGTPLPYETDYSGFMGRLGMSFYLPQSSN